MSTRTRRPGDSSASSAVRLEAVSALERAARVRALAAGVHQDDLRADLIRYAVELEDNASAYDREADRLET